MIDALLIKGYPLKNIGKGNAEQQCRCKTTDKNTDIPELPPPGAVNLAPEFEDCRNLAETSGMPLKDILNAATAAGRVIEYTESETKRR